MATDRRQRFPGESYKAKGAQQRRVTRFPRATGTGRVSKPEGRDRADMGRGAGRHGDALQAFVGGDVHEEHDYKKD